MDEIKEAFTRVKEDIDFLFNEIRNIKEESKSFKVSLNSFRDSINQLNYSIKEISNRQTDRQTNRQTNIFPEKPISSTDIIQNQAVPTHNSTYGLDFKALKPQILTLSTGNKGVPTDRQTNQQTNQQTQNSSHNNTNTSKNPFENASEVLDSLDNLKKELRIKFKRLTDQEMTVFSLLYQISEEEGYSDYKTLSLKLNLSESSIRDYIGRLLNKGIPVEKTKINNKQIQLSVSKNLKKIASLQTILELRGI